MPDVLITSTAAANPIPLAAKCTNFRKLTLVACKGLAGPATAPNTGAVFIGRSATPGAQPFVMNPGDERTFDEGSGRLDDLAGLFLRVATDGDGVVASYL